MNSVSVNLKVSIKRRNIDLTKAHKPRGVTCIWCNKCSVFLTPSRVDLFSNPCFVQAADEIASCAIWCQCSPCFTADASAPPLRLVWASTPLGFGAELLPAEEQGQAGCSLDFRSGLFGCRSKASSQRASGSFGCCCSCSSCFMWQGTTRHLVHPICTGQEICPVAVGSVCFSTHRDVKKFSSQNFNSLIVFSRPNSIVSSVMGCRTVLS